MNNLPLDKKWSFLVASSVAMLMLLFIQAHWMKNSKALIEEQFDNKVSLALCGAVQEFSSSLPGQSIQAVCSPLNNKKGCCAKDIASYIKDPELEKKISQRLAFYDIDLDFHLELSDRPSKFPLVTQIESKTNGCSLMPLQANDQYLSIIFEDKETYLWGKLKFMLAMSVLFVLLLMSVLWFGYYLINHQRKISLQNKEFFNMMAHEFKTPLTNIGLATSMLSRKQEDPLISIIQEENEFLKTEVEQVLTMASLENGQFDINGSRLDLHEMVESVIRTMQIQIDNAKATIEVRSETSPLIVSADEKHMTQAIKNLIDNSLKYSDNHPHIKINIDKLDAYGRLSISDNGIGLDAEDQKAVFEKYFRVSNGDEYRNKGFGLGLAYVKKIIDLHKGMIKVKSELDHGTTFQISLPLIIT